MFIFITIIFMVVTYGSLIAFIKRKIDVDTTFNILCISAVLYIFIGSIIK